MFSTVREMALPQGAAQAKAQKHTLFEDGKWFSMVEANYERVGRR